MSKQIFGEAYFSEGASVEMAKIFNVNGACIPELHYMVDLTSRLQQVKAMIDAAGIFYN